MIWSLPLFTRRNPYETKTVPISLYNNMWLLYTRSKSRTNIHASGYRGRDSRRRECELALYFFKNVSIQSGNFFVYLCTRSFVRTWVSIGLRARFTVNEFAPIAKRIKNNSHASTNMIYIKKMASPIGYKI